MENKKDTNAIKMWLANTGMFNQSVVMTLAAFITYTGMYAVRKPFTAGLFEGYVLMGVDYKIILITFQVLGYATSKFVGIKFIAELKPQRRMKLTVGLVVISLVFLLLFAIFPYPFGFIFLFFNGLPIGLIWGIVFSYLEGRKNTELLGAGLCTCFIISSGLVKSIGRVFVDDFNISEFFMPFLTGLVFIPIFILGAYVLNQVPEPTAEDQKMRNKREPMSKADRKNFVSQFFFGLVALVGIYIALTVFRDFRDNYAVEIWTALGYGGRPEILTITELPVAFLVLIIVGFLMVIKDNKKAFFLNFVILISGAVIVGAATLLQQLEILNPVTWMIAIGFGNYVCYIAFHTFLFERLLAVFRNKSNIGFVMYIADSFGYLGSVAILIYKNYLYADLSWLDFFQSITYIIVLIIIGLSVTGWMYFINKEERMNQKVTSNQILQLSKTI